MENYKNSKIGQETAQKYGDIIEMERPQTEESLRKHPRILSVSKCNTFLNNKSGAFCKVPLLLLL